MTETEKMRKVFHRDFLGAHRYTTRGGTVRLAGGVLGTAVVFHGQPREEATLSLRCARHNYPNCAMTLIDFFGGMFYDRRKQEGAKIMSVLKFKCRCCNSFHDIKRTVPTGFAGWSYPGMEWSDFTDEVPPLTQERWRITEEVKKIGSNNIPNVGDVRTVRVMLPFEEEIGSEFYMDYMPVSAYLDSFETANQFENSAIVKCRFTEIISADDFNAWIKVKVLDVIMFPQLAEAFPTYKTEESLEDFGTICSCNDIDADDAPWKLISWDAQGDVYEGKVIFTDAGGIAHIVWLNIEDFFTHISYFGNIIKK